MTRDDAKPLTDEEIAEAEGAAPPHAHEGPSEHGSLAAHLRDTHGVEAPDSMSDSTLEGLHDRVHSESHASEH